MHAFRDRDAAVASAPVVGERKHHWQLRFPLLGAIKPTAFVHFRLLRPFQHCLAEEKPGDTQDTHQTIHLPFFFGLYFLLRRNNYFFFPVAITSGITGGAAILLCERTISQQNAL